MSRIYLVDTENVASTWQTILPELASEDTLLVFYTKNSPGIAYTDLATLMQYVGRFECVECYAGSNGLDFQLVSYLGYLLSDHPCAEFIIISRDTGYDAVCKFWSDKGRSVTRRTHIVAGEVSEAAPQIPDGKTDDPLRERIARLLTGVASTDEMDRIADLFARGDIDQGQMHNALVLSFGAVRGLELYNMLRPIFRAAPVRSGSAQAGKAVRTARRRIPASKETAAKPAAPAPDPIQQPSAVPAPIPEEAPKQTRRRRKTAEQAAVKPDVQPAETPVAEAPSEKSAAKPRRRHPLHRKAKTAEEDPT